MPAPATSPVERFAYSPVEVAEALGVSRAHIYNLMQRGELRYSSVGHVRRIPRTELERLAGLADGDAA